MASAVTTNVRRRRGPIALALLLALMAACLGSLPWTLGRVAAGGGNAVPRYNAGSSEDARRAPFWAGGEGSPRSWLGTDTLGRSLAARCLLGGAISLAIGLAAAGVSVCIGTLYGALAGYSGGRTDAVMMRAVDVLYGLPYVLLVVLLAVAGDAMVDRYATRAGSVSEDARAGLDLLILLVAIGGVSWLTPARVVRGQVLSLKARPFIEAARAMGASPRRVFTRHLLPNLSGTIIAYATLTVPQAMLQEAFLSFLGIGVKPPLPSWGRLAAEGLSELNPYQSNWWLLVFPCGLLSGTLLLMNVVGEWTRERLAPR